MTIIFTPIRLTKDDAHAWERNEKELTACIVNTWLLSSPLLDKLDDAHVWERNYRNEGSPVMKVVYNESLCKRKINRS